MIKKYQIKHLSVSNAVIFGSGFSVFSSTAPSERFSTISYSTLMGEEVGNSEENESESIFKDSTPGKLQFEYLSPLNTAILPKENSLSFLKLEMKSQKQMLKKAKKEKKRLSKLMKNMCRKAV